MLHHYHHLHTYTTIPSNKHTVPSISLYSCERAGKFTRLPLTHSDAAKQLIKDETQHLVHTVNMRTHLRPKRTTGRTHIHSRRRQIYYQCARCTASDVAGRSLSLTVEPAPSRTPSMLRVTCQRPTPDMPWKMARLDGRHRNKHAHCAEENV